MTWLGSIHLSPRAALWAAVRHERDEARGVHFRPWAPHAAAAVLTGVLFGGAAGLSLADGDLRPSVAALLFLATVPFLARIFPPGLRLPMTSVLFVALAARFAAAVVVYDASVAAGHAGWVTGDDWSYSEVSWGIASWLHGTPYPGYFPPEWNTDAYLIGTYVDIESAVFFLFGRQVLLMDFLNSWALVLSGAILFDLGRRLFGTRPAIFASLGMLCYPSIFAWSILNLKDALALLIITATFWILARFQRTRSWGWLVVLFVLLYAMQSLRRYIYLLLLLACFVGLLAMLRGVGARPRLTTLVGALAALALFVSDINSPGWYGRIDLDLFASLRQGMAEGARTSFQEPAPIRLVEGETYVIAAKPTLAVASPTPVATPTPTPPPGGGGGGATAPPTPTPTPEPTCTPSVRHLDRPVQLIVNTLARPGDPPPGAVYVCPGDTLVVGADTTPAPVAEQRPLAIDNSAKFVIRPNPVGSSDRAVIRTFNSLQETFAYLPKGITYAVMAPFPWAVERRLDLLTAPEMILWYAIVALAAVSLWRLRSRWSELVALLVYSVGLVMALSLVEGNYGTLYRHRAMLIPFVILLASPVLATIRWRRASR